MEFKVNPLCFSKGIFAVPNLLVDENIKLAGTVQLRTLLYLMRHSAEGRVTKEEIGKALSLNKDDVLDALVFWRERGLVIEEDEKTNSGEKEKPAEKKEPETKIILQKEKKPEKKESLEETKKPADIPISRPNHEQIAARCKESEELRILFREAQNSLGKTIGYDGQSVLIMMFDSYGLPVEVILMAIEYAKTKGSGSFAQIAKIGKKWNELEIDSIEGACEYIEEHTVVDDTWEKLRSMTEITNRNPTEKQRRFMTKWVKEYGYDSDIIYFAYEESIDRTGKMNFPYMDKIIDNWKKNNVKTTQDIQREKMRWENEKGTKYNKKKEAKAENKDASYNLDEYSKKSLDMILNAAENNS